MKSFARRVVEGYLHKRNKVAIDLAELDRLQKAAQQAKEEVLKEGNVTGHWAAMERLQRRKLPIRTIIDVGASDGQAVAAFKPYFPHVAYYCVEAEQKHEIALAEAAKKNPKLKFVIAAAGSEKGEVFFDASPGDLYSGKASTEGTKTSRKVRMTTLDDEVAANNLEGPFLIKLDTHGFELPILEGARETLKKTEALIIEAYNIRFDQKCPLFYELCQIMADRGFACADLTEPQFRPSDLILWQVDLIFLKQDRPEFSNRNYP